MLHGSQRMGGSTPCSLAAFCGPVLLLLCLFNAQAPAAGYGDCDPRAEIADVFAFMGVKFDDPGQHVLNVILHVCPFSEPGRGGVYERFGTRVLYSIHIADPASGESLVRYDFRFSNPSPAGGPALKNPDTILSYGRGTELGSIFDIGDPRQNFVQTYSVARTAGGAPAVIGSGLMVPPPNAGLRTTPFYNDAATGKAVSGATQFFELDPYTQQSIYNLPSGEAVFAGTRDNGFFADIAGLFDLLDTRTILPSPPGTYGQEGIGVDAMKGCNVLAIAIQIPIKQLPSLPYEAPFFGPATGVGVYATTSIPRITVNNQFQPPQNFGGWIQVDRMGNPLFSRLLIPLRDKDRFSRTAPVVDAALFSGYAEAPELAFLMNTVWGLSLTPSGRTDLAGLYIPDVLRVDTTTGPVRLAGQSGYSRFSHFGGDLTASGQPSGWPNGRRFGDDAVDIAFTALASGPLYSTITYFGDNIAANDQVYHQVFPYSATPHSGARHSKDSGVNDE